MEQLKHRSDWDARLKAMAETARENRKRLQAWEAAHSDPEPSTPVKTQTMMVPGALPVTQTKR